MLNRLVDLNRYLLKSRRLGPLYKSGVRYVPEPNNGVEDWQAVDVLYRSGEGDCEDLACALCAQRRNEGLDARIRLTKKGRIWHVTIRIGDRVEDPSRVLGMES